MGTDKKVNIFYRFIVGYLYILLFGGWILKTARVPDEMGLKILSVLDIVPLFLFCLVNPKWLKNDRIFFVRNINFWGAWFVLLLLLVFTAILHKGSLAPSLVHFGALIRYIPLAYIICSLSKDINVSDKLIYHIKAISIILLSITTVCIILGPQASIFLPVMPVSATGIRELANGSYSAIFANTIDLAFILVIIYILWCSDRKLVGFRFVLLSLWFAVCVFKTGSATATAVFCLFFMLRITESNKFYRNLAFFVFGIIAIFLYFRYQMEVRLIIENMQLSRLGILSMTAPDFIKELSFDTFFGVGNDSDVVLSKINSYPDKVHMLYWMDNIDAFGDVYWVALLVYHGLIGFLLISLIFYKMYVSIIRYDLNYGEFNLKRIVEWSYIAIVLLGFMNQVLVVKTFAVTFWILMAVVYVRVSKSIKTNESITDQ